MDLFEKVKRVAVTLLGMGLIAVNKKLGLGFGAEEVGGIASLVVGYVWSGSWKATRIEEAKKAIEEAHINGESAKAQVKTMDDSLNTINEILAKANGQVSQ